ncbi:acyl-CoA dehydrogenase family protein [Streptomyces albipurpureus]|uniref:Acyl-CoA/acyl-ACP dehydrogenase n=1 Tax=Streptomyces albipurpureus TaxID=2897419 RepID=A0ABT0UHC1_9ACTN|nr:acyl-CoA dehydrogenase family protein [Streptomyces sp. CWNU-1]MCM2387576.1 acyl-CoA/acyl-ACP dehydrogenase [Streptomyces sp. CWNU-1]
MRITLTDDQIELQRSVRSLFAKECPPELVRELRADDTTMDPQRLWTSLADTGILGLPFSEDVGGQGAGLFELGLVLQEAGRVLCPTIVYSTLAFGITIDRLGSPEQRRRWLRSLAAGELRASTALWNPSDSGDIRPTVTARRDGDTWHLAGTIDFVQNADVVDAVLVSARTLPEDGPERTLAFILTPGQDGWRSERHRTFGRDIQCRVHLDLAVHADDDRVIDLLDGGLDESDLRWVANAVTALQCMEMVGGAAAVLDRTVDYVKVREQFGRPLAGFQAVQHLVADAHIAVAGARLVAAQACWRTARGELAEREVAIAKLHSNEAYKLATLNAHQAHGGMGYILETGLHMWSERAKTAELLGGAWDTQIGRLEQALGLVGAPAERTTP